MEFAEQGYVNCHMQCHMSLESNLAEKSWLNGIYDQQNLYMNLYKSINLFRYLFCFAACANVFHL